MPAEIRRLVEQLHAVEDELREALYHQHTRKLFSIEGAKIRFHPEIAKSHRSLQHGLSGWFLSSRPQNILSAPFIYGMAIPMVVYDVFLSLYQAICFPLYQIPKVQRASYIRIDRYHLGYLNLIERLNCIFCGYANGLLAYAAEITGRTEQYWCPIKHAHKLLGTHRRYADFLDFGDADDYPARLEQYRRRLREQSD